MSTSLPPTAPDHDRREPTAEPSATVWLSSAGSLFAETPQHRVKRAAGATLGSIVAHALLIAIGMFLLTRPRPTPVVEDQQVPLGTLVFLESVPGPGGGGGGSPEPAPPKPVVIPKTEAPPPEPVPLVPPPPVVTPPPPPMLTVPVMTQDADAAQATGTSAVSLASYGGGGRGAGLGSGSGDGVGPGRGTGFGDGIARPGSGINNPRVLREQRPLYTSEAMRAKIQGNVELEVIVLADGSVGNVKVTKSLDRTYGLDQEAIKAARLWQFAPATDRTGKPVPIVVTIVLSFTIH